MLMEFVFLLVISAKHQIPMETVFLVTLDMTLSTESANSQLSTMLNLPIQDVPNGTGTTKFVSNAQRTGPLMLMESALLSPINVLLMMPMELVSHATRAMT